MRRHRANDLNVASTMWCALSPRRFVSETLSLEASTTRAPEGLGEASSVLADALASGAGAVGREVEREGALPGDGEGDDARRVGLVEGDAIPRWPRGTGRLIGDGVDARGEHLRERAAEGEARGDGDGLVVVARRVDARNARDAVLGDDDGDAELAVGGELVDHVVQEGQAGGDLAPLAEVNHRRLGEDAAQLGAAGAVGPGHRGRRDGGSGRARSSGSAVRPGAEGRLPGFVAGVPRTANGAANGAADDAMNALCGVCVATKRRFCVERACSSAAEVEIKFVLFSGGQTRPF